MLNPSTLGPLRRVVWLVVFVSVLSLVWKACIVALWCFVLQEDLLSPCPWYWSRRLMFLAKCEVSVYLNFALHTLKPRHWNIWWLRLEWCWRHEVHQQRSSRAHGSKPCSLRHHILQKQYCDNFCCFHPWMACDRGLQDISACFCWTS